MLTVEIQILIEQVAVLDDQRAFQRLFNLYYAKLKRFAIAILKDQQLAEELVCDVFIKIWDRRSKLLEVKNINSYLYIVTKNMAIKRLTTSGRNEIVSLDSLEIEPVFVGKNPEELLLNNELIKCYDIAVSKLPARCQTVYRLAKQDGLKYKEIAEILNLSIKTVDAQLAIAVKRVAKSVQLIYKLK
ncbi:RNA polymerase sigma-70 factor [Niabella ginsengisoli]|uniref:RNA polymerase sigma-70 factor n=1 Tax=Niabella ginsengisoli TaxID=522298 RepID=A0ABS9SL23_9BACT|nr:RNA polymerase sigma-70 factor [Niabella ginsengisoli]MCH5599005.1 RNA polymerase sigma-70 factor [Niabella ginsengisoli]